MEMTINQKYQHHLGLMIVLRGNGFNIMETEHSWIEDLIIFKLLFH